MNRQEKSQQVESIRALLEQAQLVVLTDYRGLSVPDMVALRGAIREARGSYRIMKNSLAKLATSGTELEPCSACNGRGRVRYQQGMFPIAVERTCARCHGSGRVVVTPCEDCGGAGLRSSAHSVEVTIPPGVEDGATRSISGMGNATRTGRRPGSLEIGVRVKPHDFFQRVGDNVICNLPITFPQAALGDEIEIPTLDGKGFMRVPPGTQPGTVLRVRGKGIPRRHLGGRGDQLVEVQVEVPTDLSDRQKELIAELADELGEAVQPQQRTFMDKLRSLFN